VPTRPQHYVGVRDAAAFLGMSKSFLDKVRVAGDGPKYHRFGTAIRYTLEALSEWAEQQANKAAEPPKAA